jgi:hypothetical protein
MGTQLEAVSMEAMLAEVHLVNRQVQLRPKSNCGPNQIVVEESKTKLYLRSLQDRSHRPLMLLSWLLNCTLTSRRPTGLFKLFSDKSTFRRARQAIAGRLSSATGNRERGRSSGRASRNTRLNTSALPST